MDRDGALELARARLFALRAVAWEELAERARRSSIEHEEIAGGGGLHCRFLVTHYTATEVDGRPAVRVSVNVEDGGWAVLEHGDVEFVRTE